MPSFGKIFFFSLFLFDPSIALQAKTKSERESPVVKTVETAEVTEPETAGRRQETEVQERTP